MTYAPMQQITAALTALALHGFELPAAPTRVTVPRADVVRVDIDASGLGEATLQAFIAAAPADTKPVMGTTNGRGRRYGFSCTVVSTAVLFTVFTDADEWKAAA